MKTAFVFSVVLICAPAALGQAVTGFSGGTEYPVYYGGSTGDVIGWRFTVASDMEVTDLGVWNADQTGLLDSSHEVGIWDDSQNLLTSVVVDMTGTAVGDWTYESVTPVVLSPGTTYTIGALYTADDNDYYVSSASSMTTDPDVTWLSSVYPSVIDLGFVYPELESTSYGRFGPNFMFGPTSLQQSTWGAIKASM
jgi:hypothetical protein